jgi:Putative Ig domain
MAIRKSSNSGIPFGNNSGRPANPSIGQPYFNGQEQRLEIYTNTGGGSWQNIVAETPGVISYTGNVLEPNTTNTIVINGTNFASGAIAYLIGNDLTEYTATTTTVNSIVQITAVFGVLPAAKEPYDIKIVNPSNLYGILSDIVYVNSTPTWNTAAGSLGTFDELSSVSLSVSVSDAESQTITYSSSNLPNWLSLNSSTGALTGTAPAVSSNTTYSFNISATDGSNTTSRAFSITVNNAVFTIEALVVGGGGGGGGRSGGGGGAGGLVYHSGKSFESGNTALVTVGTGGAGGGGGGAPGSNYESAGSDGTNSVFSDIVALGGGGGYFGDTGAGKTGGSGGGGGYGGGGGSATQGNSGGGTGYGNAGGGSGLTGTYSYKQGGGGGAGGAGVSGNVSTGKCGDGGAGLQYSITGTAQFYAGGGGGGGHDPYNSSLPNSGRGLGGSGVGGNGGPVSGSDGQPTQGVDGTGSGGGGTWSNGGSSYDGGKGGNGVVIIAYPDSKPAISNIPGTLTYDQPTRAGYRVYRFTAGTGTITF